MYPHPRRIHAPNTFWPPEATESLRSRPCRGAALGERNRSECEWHHHRNILHGSGQFTIDAAVAKLTRVGGVDTELRLEAFNLLNHPVFANPASTIGAANAGTISSLLPFTPMRQLQFACKARF